MKSTRARLMARLPLALAALFALAPALFVATGARAQIVTAEDRCRADLADGSRRYMERVVKARVRCQSQVILGTLPPITDCLAGRGDSAMNKRLTRAENQLSNVGADCTGVNLNLLGFPGSCRDLTGSPFDTEDFKTCVVSKTNTILVTLFDYYYPHFVDLRHGVEAKCMIGAARDAARSFLGIIQAREACLIGQDFQTVGGTVDCRNDIEPYGSGTGDTNVDGDIGDAYVQLLGAVPTACATTQIDDLDYQSSCIDPTGGLFTILDLKKCLFDANRDGAISTINVPFPAGAVCGDGVVNGDEQCDDGIDGNSDTKPNACRTNCKNPVCGDGVTDTNFNETCDDGNSVANDCCTACHPDVCGDGVKSCTEQCDNGPDNSNTNPNACRTNCKNPTCGDGVTDTGEVCDDGNTASCDGCRGDCKLIERCGNGVVEACRGEECDLGDTLNSDSKPDTCRTNCKDPRCGDGVVDAMSNGEDCDDGNTLDGDSCPSTCAICGNNKKSQLEECDGTDIGACLPGEGCDSNCDCVPGVCPSKGELILYSGIGEDCAVNADCPVGTCDVSLGKCRTVTRLDSGWTGDGDQADINNAVKVTGLLSCPGHGPTCGECAVTNVDASSGNCRCSSVGGSGTKCDVPFATNVSNCLMCENAEKKSKQACATNADCIDDSPRCSKTSPVCTNDNSKVCTTNADCGAGKCAPKVCTNNGSIACTSNTDCGGNACKAHGLCSQTGSKTTCTADSDCYARGTCSGHADCACYFGAPFPLSSAGTPACVVNRFSKPVSGTANVDLGAGEISADLRTKVYLGQSGVTDPCPTCGGICSPAPASGNPYCDRDVDCPAGSTCTHQDPTADDDVKGGFCTAGQNQGQPCDVNAFNTTFPVYSDGVNGGGYSLDCLPSEGKNISGDGLVIKLTQTTGHSEMAAHVSCQDENQPDLKCPCLVCSGDNSVPCNTDNDCAGQNGACTLATTVACQTNTDCATANVGTCNSQGHCSNGFNFTCSTNSECTSVNAGTCTPSACTDIGGAGTPAQPNKCDNLECTANPDGTGTCTTGPIAKYCAGILRTDGTGLIPCAVDSDCAPPFQLEDVGPCTHEQLRLCLPDPYFADGAADPSKPIGAATFCIPPTANGGINIAAGLPGPGRVVNQAKSRTFCGPNADKVYVPGVGCPQ